jgi:hypothetical protein
MAVQPVRAESCHGQLVLALQATIQTTCKAKICLYFERLQLAGVYRDGERGAGLPGVALQGLVPAHGLFSSLTHEAVVLLHAASVHLGVDLSARASGWTFEPRQ